MFRRLFPPLLILTAAAQSLAQAPMPEKPEEAPQPPPGMRGGFGKGKGKGKGRPMTPPSPPTAPTTGPTTPAKPPQVPANAQQAPQAPQKACADFFSQKILPVLQQKCFNCHQAGRKMKGGLAVDSHAALLAGGDSGPALVPGDAAKSVLYVSMTYADADLQMPPRERLSAAVLADFKQWIEMGAPFGAGNTPVTGGTPVTPAAEGSGFFATITAVRGSSVTYTRDENSGGGMMRGGMGKGKGKGGMMRGGGGAETTQKVAEKALITTATLARRTQDLLVGIELSGGLANPAFEAVKQGGVKAHLVVKDGQITELNLITAQEESDAPIAVKPKRPATTSNSFKP
jgi:hypothetical protein